MLVAYNCTVFSTSGTVFTMLKAHEMTVHILIDSLVNKKIPE